MIKAFTSLTFNAYEFIYILREVLARWKGKIRIEFLLNCAYSYVELMEGVVDGLYHRRVDV